MPSITTFLKQRTLAFASEGAVAGEALIPRPLYFGLWGLSGLAIVGDITTKVFDAPEEKRKNTAIYQTAFHIPASLVVPAVIIHQIVHGMQYSMKNHGYAKKFPPRVKALIPVSAALASILPVVPVVDHTFEFIMEPTLGKYSLSMVKKSNNFRHLNILFPLFLLGVYFSFYGLCRTKQKQQRWSSFSDSIINEINGPYIHLVSEQDS